MSLAVYGKQLEQLLHRQIALTSAFNQATSLEEIARIFAKNTIVESQYVAINAFNYAADYSLESARAIVTANRADTFQVDDDVDVNLEYLNLVHASLKADGDFLVSDPQTDNRLTTADKEWLNSRKIHSVYCLALNIQNELYGFITLIDTKRALAPTPLEKQIYQNIAEQAATVIQKRNLLEQQEEQALYLALLNDLLQRANVIQDEVTLLQEMAKIVHDVMELDHVGVSLIDKGGLTHTIVAEFPETELGGTEIEITEHGLPATLKEVRRPIAIADVENDETLLSINRDMLKRVGIKSIVMLPMLDLDENLIGTVAVDSYNKVDEFDSHKLETIKTIVSQVVVNLQKLRLIQHTQQQATQLQQIADFGQALQASLQLSEILQIALRYGQTVLKGDYVTVMLYDRTVNSLRQSAQLWDNQRRVTLPGPLVSDEMDTIAQRAWENQEIIHVDEVQADWEWKHPLITTLHSIMVAPIIAGGILRGILEIGSLRSQAFSATDGAAFRQMTNQISVAIDNAETYSQSQRLARNKVQANEIIAQIQQQPDINAILKVTAKELGKALNAKHARIRLGTSVQRSSGD